MSRANVIYNEDGDLLCCLKPGGAGATGDAVSDESPWTANAGVPYNGTTPPTYYEIPVTDSIQSAADGQPFEGFLFKYTNEANADQFFMFRTKEWTTRGAQLIIVPEPTVLGMIACATAALVYRPRRQSSRLS